MLLVVSKNDERLESNESLTATITGVAGNDGCFENVAVTTVFADQSADSAITDNDTATVKVVATDANAAETATDNGEFTVTLSKVNNTGAASLLEAYSDHGIITS